MLTIGVRMDTEEKEMIGKLLRQYESILGGEPGQTKAANIKIKLNQHIPQEGIHCRAPWPPSIIGQEEGWGKTTVFRL